MHKTFFIIMVILTNQELDDPFLWMGSTASRLKNLYKKLVYFLPLSSQKFLVLT